MRTRTFQLAPHLAALLALAALIFFPSLTLAAPATQTAPAPENDAVDNARGESLTAKITGIEGLVQVRVAEDAPWKRAELGMIVPTGGEFRTGLRSAVRFVIPPDQIITLDRLGTVKLIEAVRNEKKVRTDLGMKYGRTRYDIEAAGLEHQSVIHSPGATLAIRGTKVSLYNQVPFNPEVRSLIGEAILADAKQKKGVKFGNKLGNTAIVQQGQNNAAQTAAISTGVETRTGFGTTQTENLLNLSYAAYGGSDFSDLGVLSLLQEAQRGTFHGSVAGVLPVGELLDFRLTWTGAAGTDVDLSVTSPRGEVVFRGGGQVPSSGQFDDSLPGVADQFGFGEETVQWTVSFPPGHYSVRAQLISGAAANVNLQVVQDPFGRGDTIHNSDFVLTPGSTTHTEVVTAPGPPVH